MCRTPPLPPPLLLLPPSLLPHAWRCATSAAADHRVAPPKALAEAVTEDEQFRLRPKVGEAA
jgi:hypothetical protein